MEERVHDVVGDEEEENEFKEVDEVDKEAGKGLSVRECAGGVQEEPVDEWAEWRKHFSEVAQPLAGGGEEDAKDEDLS